MALMIWQMQTFMLVLMSILHLVNSQATVSITTTNLSPQLGDTGFSLQCNIVNFVPAQNRALAWTKDGDLVSWNREIHGGFNGQTREIVISSVTTYYYLDFFQVASTHAGTYKCLIANGQPTSYTEAVSAEVLVQVPYFPPEPYPICSPNVPTIAVVGTIVTLSCTSLPGYPDEVTLILQRGGQTLTAGGTVSGNMKELQTSYTITSADSGMSFACRMMGTGIFSTISRTCNIGPFEVVAGLPRISPTMLTKSERQDAIFTCELSSSGTINWYTVPPTQSSRSTSNGMTFTLLNVQLSDNGKVVVCMATIGGAVVEDRAHLTVNSFVPPPTMAPTTKPPITIKETVPVVPTNPPGSIIIMSTTKQTTDKRLIPGNSQPTDIVTNLMDTTEDSPIASLTTPLSGVPDQIILIAIGAVGGLVFILIIVIVAACVCCYSRRPKPIIMTGDNQSDSGDSWDADGAMTRRSRICVVDNSSNPPPRLPASTNYGYEDAHTHANNLLKIPDDGLSTVRTSSTMSPSLAYAMDYLSQPEDPMKDDDMSSTAFTVDSRAYGGGMGQYDDHKIYSQGQTSFRDDSGTQGQAYEEDSGTFVRHPGPLYDTVPKDQDPDMPTYAVPHRDRSSKQLKNVDNNDERQISSSYNNDQNAPDLTRHRMSSVPYVNTAFPRNSGGFVENSIYQSAEQNMQYF